MLQGETDARESLLRSSHPGVTVPRARLSGRSEAQGRESAPAFRTPMPCPMWNQSRVPVRGHMCRRLCVVLTASGQTDTAPAYEVSTIVPLCCRPGAMSWERPVDPMASQDRLWPRKSCWPLAWPGLCGRPQPGPSAGAGASCSLSLAHQALMGVLEYRAWSRLGPRGKSYRVHTGLQEAIRMAQLGTWTPGDLELLPGGSRPNVPSTLPTRQENLDSHGSVVVMVGIY